MIYEFPAATDPILQGDIFVDLPRIEVSLRQMIVVGDQGESLVEWSMVAGKQEPINIIVPVRPVAAIVAPQDCDATRCKV